MSVNLMLSECQSDVYQSDVCQPEDVCQSDVCQSDVCQPEDVCQSDVCQSMCHMVQLHKAVGQALV